MLYSRSVFLDVPHALFKTDPFKIVVVEPRDVELPPPPPYSEHESIEMTSHQS